MNHSEERIFNFAWGSHLSIEQYAKILRSQPHSRRKAILHNHRLTASQLKMFPDDQAILAGDGGGPRFQEAPGESLYGVLYEISQAQWEILDTYEREWGFDDFEVEVETEDGNVTLARVHNLVEHGDFKAPSNDFIDTMKRGLHELNYDTEVISTVIHQLTEPF